MDFLTDRTRSKNRPSTSSGGQSHTRPDLAALQGQADQSATTTALGVLQRAGDDDGDDYIVTMVNDKIGSVYFLEGRIRTTHIDGPQDERGKQKNAKRYNISRAKSWAAFEAADNGSKTQDDNPTFAWQDWVAEELAALDEKGAKKPDWFVCQITDASKLSEQGEPDVILFETYEDSEGDSYVHDSRGAAVKKRMTTKQMDLLKEALAASGKMEDPHEKNEAFYTVVKRDPALAKLIRTPEEAKA